MSNSDDQLSGSAVSAESGARVATRYDNRITLQKLEVLCAVVDLGGVSRAADHFWVAQSVISGHLRSLQERLGVQVLYRDGQRMKLTKAGEQVYQWASETLSNTRELMRRLDDLDEATSGTLALAASQSVGSYLLPPILAECRKARPRAIITMKVSDPQQAFAAVATGECDLAIAVADAEHEHPQMRSEVIGREKIALVVAPDDQPGVDKLSLVELSNIGLVAAPAGHMAREFVDRLLIDRGVLPQNVVMEIGHPEGMKRIVRTGVAASLLFRSCVEDELNQGTLREIAIVDADLSLDVICVTRVDRQPTFLQSYLIDQTRARLASRWS